MSILKADVLFYTRRLPPLYINRLLLLRHEKEIKVHIMCIDKTTRTLRSECDCFAVVGCSWWDCNRSLSNLHLSSEGNCVNPILVSQWSALITSLLILMWLTELRLWSKLNLKLLIKWGCLLPTKVVTVLECRNGRSHTLRMSDMSHCWRCYVRFFWALNVTSKVKYWDGNFCQWFISKLKIPR